MGIQFTGLASGLDTQSIISDLMKAERTRVESVEKDKILSEWKKDAWQEMNAKLYGFYKDELNEFKSSGTYNQKKVTSSNESTISVNSSNSAVRGSHEITVNNMAKGSFLTGSELTGVSNDSTATELFGITGSDTKTISISMENSGTPVTHDITIEVGDTMKSIVEKIEDLDLDLSVSFDSSFNRLFLSSTKTGSDIDLRLSGDDTVLTGLGFATTESRDGSDGADASFTYNNADFTSESNEVTVNGLSFDILADTGTSTITVTQDTEAIYGSVKSFILKYNELALDMTEKVSAGSARDYQPLSAEEKATMTDDDISLWEGKIKDSLLRRDDTLMSITGKLRDTLTMSSGINTSSFTHKTLSSLGIVTGAYTEKGILHIEGDEDDVLYSFKENKLKDAIEADPESVGELLTAVGSEIFSSFAERMKSSSMSSALTFYNDKSLNDEIDSYESDIYDLEDKLSSIEARYYKQFTAMEQAIQQSNSTGDWLSQQLGGM